MKYPTLKKLQLAASILAVSAFGHSAYAIDAAQQPAPADGWASQSGGTLGGSAADTSGIYTVSNRAQLLAALANGGSAAKIVKIVGTIDMSEGVAFSSHADQATRAAIALPSNTTLIGDATNAGIVNGYINIASTSQVIIRNLKIVAPCDVTPVWDAATSTWNSSFPAIQVSASNHVWIDHNTFTDTPVTNDTLAVENGAVKECHDGALDITSASDFVTVSYNLFNLHNKNNLVGASDTATGDAGHLTVTFSNNVFNNISMRTPRVRYGQVHLFNNYYLGSKSHPVYPHFYSVGAGVAAKILSNNNVFEIAGASTCNDVVTNPSSTAAAGAFKDTGSTLNGLALTSCALSNSVSWTAPYAFTVRPIALVKANALAQSGSGKLTTAVTGTGSTSSSSSSVASSVASSAASSVTTSSASSSTAASASSAVSSVSSSVSSSASSSAVSAVSSSAASSVAVVKTSWGFSNSAYQAQDSGADSNLFTAAYMTGDNNVKQLFTPTGDLTADMAAFFAGSGAVSADGLIFNASVAAKLRYRASTAPEFWGTNGSFFSNNAQAMPEVGQDISTFASGVPLAYMGIPVSSGSAFTITVTYRQNSTNAAAGGSIGLIGSDNIVLSKATVAACTSCQNMTISYSAPAGHVLTNVKIFYSRDGTSSGGVNIYQIDRISSATTASSASSSVASSSVASSSIASSSGNTSSSSTSSASSASSTSASSASAGSITSLGADGWASYGTNNLGTTGTTGGDGAAAGKIYTVTNRNELINALYGGTASISANGSVSGTLDSSKKIIYVSGTISLNVNKALAELTDDDYVTYGASACSGASAYATASAMWTAYYAAYRPSVWGTAAAWISPHTGLPTGVPETARACYAEQQKKVVYVAIPSNTSIIGIGLTAKIIHGNLVVGGSSSSPVDNVIIRNVAFEDSFDFFPAWDPTDSTSGRWNSAYDNVSVMYASHVWIDHNTFSDGSRIDSNYPSPFTETYAGTNYGSASNALLFHVQHHDGLSDFTKNANYVTSSYNHYHDHDKSILMGGTDTASTTAENPSALKVTFHNNYFQNLRQRQPRVRYGMVHLYNNYFSNSMSAANYPWSVAWFSGESSKLYVENNAVDVIGASSAGTVYGGSSGSKSAACATTTGTTTAYCSAYAYHAGNLLNGNALDVSGVSASGVTTTSTPWFAAGVTSGAPTAKPSDFYSYTPTSTTGLSTSVPANAGAGKL